MDIVEQAHCDKDANQFYGPNAENWYDVRQGTVSRLNKVEMIPATQAYLDDMEFQEMIKRDDPIIEISNDGTMASYIGSAAIKGVLKEKPVFWVVSWQSVLKKMDGEWKIISSANTEADKATGAIVLLNQIRNSLGELEDKASIYADAQCTAPETSFRTLILSDKTGGRMEQIYGDHHIIMKHGSDTTWTYDLNSKKSLEGTNRSTKIFVQGHELHWLGFWPEDRYNTPILKDITKFLDQTAFHIEFRDAYNRPVNFYYAFNSYRPLGFDMQTNAQGDIVTVRFEKWEKIDKVFVFKNATFEHGRETFRYNFTDIRFNYISPQDFESKIALIR